MQVSRWQIAIDVTGSVVVAAVAWVGLVALAWFVLLIAFLCTGGFGHRIDESDSRARYLLGISWTCHVGLLFALGVAAGLIGWRTWQRQVGRRAAGVGASPVGKA